jgi:hypothetical protein
MRTAFYKRDITARIFLDREASFSYHLHARLWRDPWVWSGKFWWCDRGWWLVRSPHGKTHSYRRRFGERSRSGSNTPTALLRYSCHPNPSNWKQAVTQRKYHRCRGPPQLLLHRDTAANPGGKYWSRPVCLDTRCAFPHEMVATADMSLLFHELSEGKRGNMPLLMSEGRSNLTAQTLYVQTVALMLRQSPPQRPNNHRACGDAAQTRSFRRDAKQRRTTSQTAEARTLSALCILPR